MGEGIDKVRAIYGLGAIGLGGLGLAVGGFALQWEPVPEGLPLYQPLAYLGAAWLLIGGVACLFRRTSAWGSLALGVQYGLWVLLLHLPKALAHADQVAAWLALAESLALCLGGLLGWAAQGELPRVSDLARRLFGTCGLVFGASHFVYADITASMVPAFYPFPMAWALMTGAAHLAAGASFLSGVLDRLAATCLAAMFAVFVLTLHLPRVLSAPTDRLEWTMLFVALSLTGAVWNLRGSLAGKMMSPLAELQIWRRKLA
jgi:uncharacterized membrane protein